MKSIEEYIEEAKSMENTSDGGSPAYHFDDVVLVKYTIPTKYGYLARENEEQIAAAANKKRAQGVRTPYHYAIKRTVEGEIDVCWVLQERAKGKSFAIYNSYQNDPKTQLMKQEALVNAPDAYFEKCVSDLSALMNMGLELKDKNIYYDENSGFTFIDLLQYDETPLNPNSLKDILWLNNNAGFIYQISTISIYDDKATEEEKQKSKELKYQLMQKVFQAMEKTIPNFGQYRRWVLRHYSQEVLEYFESHGTIVGDLSLTEEEYGTFKSIIDQIVNDSLQKVDSGNFQFWQIGINEIRIDLDLWGMQDAWRYHRSNQLSKSDFDCEYDYECATSRELQAIVNNLFHERLDSISKEDASPNLLKAKEDLEKKRMSEAQRKGLS